MPVASSDEISTATGNLGIKKFVSGPRVHKNVMATSFFFFLKIDPEAERVGKNTIKMGWPEFLLLKSEKHLAILYFI